MGLNAANNNDMPLAVEYWEKASAEGHLLARHQVALIYLKGANGVPQNTDRAVELLLKGAEDGYAESQYLLGFYYINGNGVPQNDFEAFKWIEKAALQGDASAQKDIGICYSNGRGVNVDKKKAMEWFEKAAGNGNMQASLCLADMYAEGDGISTDYSKAENWYQKIISNKNNDFYDEALFSLALMYSSKMNDYFKAFPLWRELAERGDMNSQFNFGLCYHNGWGTVVNNEKAIFWWRKAAEQGHADAQYNIDMLMQQEASNNSYGNSQSDSSSTGKSGGCYIATAVYGSYDCPEVWTLRRFRDYTLAETWYGRAFIHTYYAVSPALVKWFGNTNWFKQLWKGKLDKMVTKLKNEGVEDTPYQDKNF